MGKSTDIRVTGARLYFIPIQNRVPLKFGPETVTSVTCARACVQVADRQGRAAEGWGETPLSVQWVWPSKLPYEPRLATLKEFCRRLANAWAGFSLFGHPIEVGQDFQEQVLPRLWREIDPVASKLSSGGASGLASGPIEGSPVALPPRAGEGLPWLGALVCCSVFDQALHDAYGVLHRLPVYSTYCADWMTRDLAAFLQPATGTSVSFRNRYPQDFLLTR